MQITIEGKSYESGKVTAAQSRRALELNIEALDMAAVAITLKETKDPAGTCSMLSTLAKNLDGKAALINEVFNDQFDAMRLSAAEINAIINEIVKGS